jgi:3-oxoacyl-ACP reductase-like protein
MGLMDDLNKLAGKAKDAVEESGDKIAAGVDKVTDAVDKKTDGKYHDKLEQVDNLAAKLDKTNKGAATDAGAGTAATDATPTEATPPTPGS